MERRQEQREERKNGNTHHNRAFSGSGFKRRMRRRGFSFFVFVDFPFFLFVLLSFVCLPCI